MKDQNIVYQYLYLLEGCLWNKKCYFDNNVLEQILDLSDCQQTTAILSYGLITNRLVTKDQSLYKRLIYSIFENTQIQQLHSKVLVEINDFFKSKSVKIILLKGLGLAPYYQDPVMRTCGDIDIFVGRSQFQDAIDAVSSLQGMYLENDSDYDRHVHAYYKNVKLEIHKISEKFWQQSCEKRYRLLEEEGLSDTAEFFMCDGNKIFIPEVSFNALYLFLHFRRHLWEGAISLRQVCDWLLFINANYQRIDNSYLSKNLRKLGLLCEWKIFVSLGVDYLGISSKVIPLYDKQYSKKSHKLLNVIINRQKHNIIYDNTKSGIYIYTRQKVRSYMEHLIHHIRLFSIFPRQAFFSFFLITLIGLREFCCGIRIKNN